MITLAGDDRTGSKTRDWEVDDPDSEQIYGSIAALDGQRLTEISVTEDQPFRYLSIAGGPDLYLVTGELAEGEMLHLKDFEAGSEQVELVCGGQRGIFERSALVIRSQAISAVSEFLSGFPDGIGDPWHVE